MQSGVPCWETPKTISAFTSWEGRGWRWSVFYNGNQKFKINKGKKPKKMKEGILPVKVLKSFLKIPIFTVTQLSDY